MNHYKVHVVELGQMGRTYDVDVHADDVETTDWGGLLFIRYRDDLEEVVAMFNNNTWVYFKKMPKTCRCSAKVPCRCNA